MPKIELYGSSACQYTRAMRERLEWMNRDFDEYDVEGDPEAFARMVAATGGQRIVPVLVEDGKAIQIGFEGRGCIVGDPNRA